MIHKEQRHLDKIGFYSNFFKKDNFLSAAQKDNWYLSDENLASQGLDGLDFYGKTVCEIGAGGGRLTLSLAKRGVIQQAKEYLIVEPSSGIRHIQELLAEYNLQNVRFINCDLENISANVDAGKIDYVLLIGVLPHVDMNLDRIVEILHSITSKNGFVHVMYSFHGFEKSIVKNIYKNIAKMNSFLRYSFSILNAILQRFCINLGSVRLKNWYVRNFFLLKRESFKRLVDHHYEIYSVDPYNVFYTYPEMLGSFLNKFSISNIYPYSFSSLFVNDDKLAVNSDMARDILNPPQSIVLLYKFKEDWFFRSVKELLIGFGYSVREEDYDVALSSINNDLVYVLGWNYFESPYYGYFIELQKSKKTLLWQMLVR